MKDLLLHIGFCIHVKLHNTEVFTQSDAGEMMDRIQKAIEQDSRCTMIIDNLSGKFMHRILYQERTKDGCA